jgi:hypothetical protein
MEGWRVILLVNGGLMLFVALSMWGLSGFTADCSGEDADCDPSSGVTGALQSWAGGLVLVGLLLLVLGAVIRRPSGPPQP